jgi:uncharacterized protein (DUF362 family)
MELNNPITRRTAVKQLLRISGVVAVSFSGARSLGSINSALAAPEKNGFIVEGLGQIEGYGVKELVRMVFDAAGGMNRFVSRGDVVALKPNLSWARRPELAATTNPQVIEGVVELCYEAGAKKVRIVDHTIHDARRCFALTGAGLVAKKTNADLVFPRSSLMKRMKIHGHRLDVWPVFTPLVEADKLINIPVAKNHGLTGLTLGIKNWIGGVGGRRYALHQDIHQSIVDLAQFFNPTVTLIDATRIMTQNGPSGGSPLDVAIKNTLILSNDPVAADSLAAGLFDYRPDELDFINLAERWGIGTSNLGQLDHKKVTM